MAVDEAIMEAVGQEEAPPTLRFYGWQPPCLSLGRFQPVAGAVNLDACRARGIDLVRRLTGGRAILHDTPERELTYSLVVPQGDPRVAGDVPASYRAISMALVRGLEQLGVSAQLTPALGHPLRPESAACFDQPSDYEIAVGGRKLVGSAQARHGNRHGHCHGHCRSGRSGRSGGTILQHGTVLLDVDLDALVAVLCAPAGVGPAAFRGHLADRLTSLRQTLGRPVAFDEVAAALADGFREAFAVGLEPGDLTPGERQRAATLARTRYASEAWTHSAKH